MSDDIPALEGEGDVFVPIESSEPAVETGVPDEEEPKRRNLVLPSEAERMRNKVNLHWKRPKSHLYDYNYDYGSNYYKGMIDYLNERGGGYKPEIPKPLTWAERALRNYTEKREAAARTRKNNPDVELLHKIRNNVHMYSAHAKTYARKFSSSIFI